MPGILFDAEADLQVNICPQFIVTQLAQREPSGRIISVIVADRCARNSAPRHIHPWNHYYAIIHCIIVLTATNNGTRAGWSGCSTQGLCGNSTFTCRVLFEA